MELKLEDFLNRENLNIQRKDGLILFDYSKTITFTADWDHISINSRGIVFNESTGKVVARAFPKFWNYEELQGEGVQKVPVEYRPNFDGKFMVMEKMDGSCGIAYFHNGDWQVNTRGSFESDQAVWAKKHLDNNLRSFLMNSAYTYLFEIIYPENRIVVNYGDKEALVLIGAIETDTGKEMTYGELKVEAERLECDIAKIYKFNSLEELLAARELLSANEEGFVITYENGYKFKLKGEEYCNIHRALCNLTPLSFWAAIDMETFKMPTEFMAALPEEFRDTIDQFKEITESMHLEVWDEVMNMVKMVPVFENDTAGKKAKYFWIAEQFDSEYVSMVLDGTNGRHDRIRDKIHRNCRPTSNLYTSVKLNDRLQRILNER